MISKNIMIRAIMVALTLIDTANSQACIANDVFMPANRNPVNYWRIGYTVNIVGG